MKTNLSRRDFFGRTAGQVVTAATFGHTLTAADREPEPAMRLPRRNLGRTGIQVPVIGMGLAPLGMADYTPRQFRAVVQAAIEKGVTYFDMQPNYGEAERYLAPVLADYRQPLFLVTKTWEKSKTAVLDSIRASLKRLGIPSVDAVLLNNIAGYDLKGLLGPNGPVAGLKEARRRGQLRFTGISGHYGPEFFGQALKTGEFDIVMAPLNFVDRHIYAFESAVLPEAARQKTAVVAMKVLGGAVGLRYDTREQKAMLGADDYREAVRYVLGLNGVACAVLGLKSVAEMRQAVAAGREYRALGAGELAALVVRGRKLATEWGKRYPEG